MPFANMHDRRGWIHALAALSLSIGLGGAAAAAGYVEEALPELVAISAGGDLPHCTGTLIAPDRVLTHRDCVTDGEGIPIGDLSVIPGIHRGAPGEPGAARKAPREFVAALHEKPGGTVVLQLGIIEERGPPDSFLSVQTPDTPLEAGGRYDVLNYAGADGLTQALAHCGAGGLTPEGRMLDCALPTTALGAPLLRAGDVVGVVSRAGTGSRAIDLPPPGGAVNTRRVEARPYAGIEVVNACDQDIHQGLTWLGLDGETWERSARRIPADSYVLLPAATIGDSVFRYARTGDGTRIWSGQDISVEMNGVRLDMSRVALPRPIGDLRLSYTCD